MIYTSKSLSFFLGQIGTHSYPVMVESTELSGSNSTVKLRKHEHLKYFGSVYCVMNNHLGGQDMGAKHKLITVALMLLTV